mmetsp:Transcript_15417/g.37900  ORF Transcript_15417/g.37900 Transcript_15417/m.37900 type:complete len:278 (-) Transcript_15417:2342-3175(-)
MHTLAVPGGSRHACVDGHRRQNARLPRVLSPPDLVAGREVAGELLREPLVGPRGFCQVEEEEGKAVVDRRVHGEGPRALLAGVAGKRLEHSHRSPLQLGPLPGPLRGLLRLGGVCGSGSVRVTFALLRQDERVEGGEYLRGEGEVGQRKRELRHRLDETDVELLDRPAHFDLHLAMVALVHDCVDSSACPMHICVAVGHADATSLAHHFRRGAQHRQGAQQQEELFVAACRKLIGHAGNDAVESLSELRRPAAPVQGSRVFGIRRTDEKASTECHDV